MVVHVVLQLLQDVRLREPVLMNLLHYAIVDLQVVVVFVESSHLVFLPANQVPVGDVVLCDALVLEPLVVVLVLVLLALVVSVLVIDTVVEVLVVELLVLPVQLAHPCVESDCHILVDQLALHLLVYRLGLRAGLRVERTEYHRPTRVVLHQGVVTRVD